MPCVRSPPRRRTRIQTSGRQHRRRGRGGRSQTPAALEATSGHAVRSTRQSAARLPALRHVRSWSRTHLRRSVMDVLPKATCQTGHVPTRSCRASPGARRFQRSIRAVGGDGGSGVHKRRNGVNDDGTEGCRTALRAPGSPEFRLMSLPPVLLLRSVSVDPVSPFVNSVKLRPLRQRRCKRPAPDENHRRHPHGSPFRHTQDPPSHQR